MKKDIIENANKDYSKFLHEKCKDSWMDSLDDEQAKDFLSKYIRLVYKYVEYNETSIIKQYYKNVFSPSENKKSIIKLSDAKFKKIIDHEQIKEWIKRRWVENNFSIKEEIEEVTSKKIKNLHEIRKIRNFIVHKFPLYLDPNEEKEEEWSDWYKNFLNKIKIGNVIKILSELYYYVESESETQEKMFVKELKEIFQGTEIIKNFIKNEIENLENVN